MLNKEKIKRGNVYLAKLNPVIGSEQNGIRPVLIIQNDIGNKYSPTVIVAPITTKYFKYKEQPTHVKIKRNKKLKVNSTILLEQIRTIDKKRLISYISDLYNQDMEKVNQAIKIALDIN